jgi:hypothetical protein
VIQHVSLAFASLPAKGLDSFAETVSAKLYLQPVFATPPVTKVALDAANADLVSKINAAVNGGPGETAAKNLAAQVVVGLLRLLANYVEGACNNDLTTLLSSGFSAASTERRKEPLPKPTGLTVNNGSANELTAKVDPIKNTRMFEGRASADGGATWLPSVFTGDSRHIIFPGLTAGVEYTIQVRALGGSTGHSDWSDISKHRVL